MKSYHWLWVIGVASLILGVYREETLQIMVNAMLICFSCIGLG